MLLSADLPTSENILVHGFVTSGGNRLSKTLGNILDPVEMSDKYGSDAVKFFIGTAAGVGKDIDYTEDWFHAIYTDQLANNYGNYVNRVITLCQKYNIQKSEKNVRDNFGSTYKRYQEAFTTFDIKEAYETAFVPLDTANKFLNEQEPWKMTDEKERDQVMVVALEYLYHITILVSPMLPEATQRVFQAL